MGWRGRRRPAPSWAIHSTDGICIAGGEGPDWWDTARPALPPIYSADCTDTASPARSGREPEAYVPGVVAPA